MSTEIAAFLAEVDELQTEVRQVVQTLDAAGLRYKPGPGFNSISAIVTHVAGSQRWWLAEVVGGRNMHRDREAEFRADDLSAEALVGRLDETMALTREVLGSVTAEMLDEARSYKAQRVTVRWILAHVLSHVALHVGHVQITRQLWDMRQGDAHRASGG